MCTLARTGRVTAIKEKLAGDSDPQSLDRKRVGDVRRSARVRIETIPHGRPEVGADFGGDARAFFCPCRLAESNMNVIPVKERGLTIDDFAAEAVLA